MSNRTSFNFNFIYDSFWELPGFFVNYIFNKWYKDKDEVKMFDKVYLKYARLAMMVISSSVSVMFVMFIFWIFLYPFSLVFPELRSLQGIPITYFIFFGILFIIPFWIYLESKIKLIREKENKKGDEFKTIKKIEIPSLDVIIVEETYPDVYRWANDDIRGLVTMLREMNKKRAKGQNYLIDVANLETNVTNLDR